MLYNSSQPNVICLGYEFSRKKFFHSKFARIIYRDGKRVLKKKLKRDRWRKERAGEKRDRNRERMKGRGRIKVKCRKNSWYAATYEASPHRSNTLETKNRFLWVGILVNKRCWSLREDYPLIGVGLTSASLSSSATHNPTSVASLLSSYLINYSSSLFLVLDHLLRTFFNKNFSFLTAASLYLQIHFTV